MPYKDLFVAQNIFLPAIRNINEKEKNKLYFKSLKDENIKLNKQLKESESRIKQINKEKNRIINTLSHDLKNPIGPIVNLLPIVIDGTKDPQLLEILEVVNRNAVYMKNLIMDTLELARLEGLDKGFEYNDLSLLDVVDDVIKDNDFYFKDKNFEIKNNINDDFFVFADQIRIKKVFSKIFSNALKYNKKENGKISINAEKQEDFIKIAIKDNGIGMTPEQAEHVFDEFYKADPSRHDMVSSGLGLTICKKIIENHGGEIWAESPGIKKGSIFYFTLKKSKSKQPKSNVKIMCVDDNEDILFSVKKGLEESDTNFKVVTARNGKECLQKLQNKKVVPNVILLDIIMPDISGWELYDKIKSNTTCNNVPVFFFTVRKDTLSVEAGKNLAEEYIEKPFEIDDLKNKIKNYLKT